MDKLEKNYKLAYRELFLERFRRLRMNSSFIATPLKDIASFYKGMRMEGTLTRTVGLRKVPWTGCFEYPPAYPPGLSANYRDFLNSTNTAYPFPTMPINPSSHLGPFCRDCGAKLVPLKRDQSTGTGSFAKINDDNKKIDFHEWPSKEEEQQSPYISRSSENYQKNQNLINEYMVYQALTETQNYPQCSNESPEALACEHQYQNEIFTTDINYFQKESVCTNCGNHFDPTQRISQELIVYIEQDTSEEGEKVEIHKTKPKSLKSYFKKLMPKRKQSPISQTSSEESKLHKYSNCVVQGTNRFQILSYLNKIETSETYESSETSKKRCSCEEDMKKFSFMEDVEMECSCQSKVTSKSEITSSEMFDANSKSFIPVIEEQLRQNKYKRKLSKLLKNPICTPVKHYPEIETSRRCLSAPSKERQHRNFEESNCIVFDMKTPQRSRTNFAAATELDEKLREKFKKSDCLYSKSIKRTQPIRKIVEFDSSSSSSYICHGKKFIIRDLRKMTQKIPRREENTKKRANVTANKKKGHVKIHPVKNHAVPAVNKYKKEAAPPVFIKRVNLNKVAKQFSKAYIEENEKGEFVIRTGKKSIKLDPDSERVCQNVSKKLEIEIKSSEEIFEKSEFSSDSVDLCDLAESFSRNLKNVRFESSYISPIRRLSNFKANFPEQGLVPDNRFEVDMCPHGSSFDIISRPGIHNEPSSMPSNIIGAKNYWIYNMKSENEDLKTFLPSTSKQSEGKTQQIDLQTAIKAIDSLSLENAKKNVENPFVYTCFCRHFAPKESESEVEEVSLSELDCVEAPLESVFPDIGKALKEREDVDVVSLLAHVLGIKHPFVEPPDIVLADEIEEAKHEGTAAKEEQSDKLKINIQRLEKKVDKEIKELDADLEERKELVGTLREKIQQEKTKLDEERGRLDVRNDELERVDPVTGEILPKEEVQDQNNETKPTDKADKN